MTAQSKGGVVSAERNRQRALEQYYQSPNICQTCDCIIQVSHNQRVADVRKKRFCNQSCSAAHTNKTNPKRIAAKISVCQMCGTDVQNKRATKGAHMKRKYCDTCVVKSRTRGRSTTEQTKQQLFSSRANWQSARSAICGNARAVVLQSGQPLVCQACGYSNHVEVCHKIPVSDFPADTSISVINALSNLVLLCPNHHWEFDNKLLSF